MVFGFTFVNIEMPFLTSKNKNLKCPICYAALLHPYSGCFLSSNLYLEDKNLMRGLRALVM